MRNIDVGVGSFFSNMVMFFIILTTGITLNRHGLTHIETTREAAEALRPLPADSQPLCLLWVLSASDFSPFRLSPGRRHTPSQKRWGGAGPDRKLKQARWFYTLILLSTAVGVGLNFAGVNPVKALYWTAVINGLLAPFLLVAILVVAADKKLMQGQPSSRLSLAAVAITTVAMFAAGIAMFVF